MNYYYQIYKKLLFSTQKKNSDLFPLLFLFLFTSFIEFIGLGLIAPYISAISEPQKFQEIKIFSFLINEENSQSYNNFLIILSLILIFVFFIKTILSMFVRWAITRFAFQQFLSLQIRLTSAYQQMSYMEYISRNTSEYIRNVKELTGNCVAAIENYLRLVSELIIIFVIIVYLCFVNIKVIICLLGILAFITFIYEFWLKPKNISYGQKKVNSSELIYKGVDAGLKGFKEIRILSKESFFLDIVRKGAKGVYINELKSSIIRNSPRYIFEFAIICFLLSFLALSVFFNQNIENTIPILGVFCVAAIRLLPGAASVVNSFTVINYSNYSINKIYNDLQKFKKRKKKKISVSIKRSNTEFKLIEMKNITFKYPNTNKYILHKANFSIKKNECIGIVGESGAGKTTTIDLFLGLLNPTSGKIFLNKKQIGKQMSDWSDMVAYLPQESLILEDTIKKNISFKNEINEKDHNEIKDSIHLSNIKKVIKSLPNGINTKIGQGGVRLSGGQNKRIALARTFFHGKKILIMDEATSSLDKKTEDFIVNQLRELKRKKTIIIVTHNKNTLKYCDKIFQIKNQKINRIKT